MNKYRIIIDTLGSDKGPETILEGAKTVLENNDNIDLIIVGDENLIKSYNLPEGRYEIIHASNTVTNFDNPVEAFYRKEKPSVFLTLERCGQDDSVIGAISSGNTGAVMVGTIKYLLNENRDRPCLATMLPTKNPGQYTCLVDTGASIDCTSSQLVSFAHLGSKFVKELYNIENPKVGLLSNGSEPTKGNKLVKETHLLLKEDKEINFIGNIEAVNSLDGLCDVLVCDGFAGNQILKNTQGVAMTLIKEIMKFGKLTNNEEVTKQLAGHIMKNFDFESNGAAIMLGSKKYVLKCRGSSNANAIVAACNILINIINNNKTFY